MLNVLQIDKNVRRKFFFHYARQEKSKKKVTKKSLKNLNYVCSEGRTTQVWKMRPHEIVFQL